MTDMTNTRFARVLGMTFAMVLAAAASYAQEAPKELLTNGGFEAGPPSLPPEGAFSFKPTGWDTNINGTNWQMLTTQDPAPRGSSLSPTYTGPDSVFGIRLNLYSGHKVDANRFFNTVNYTLSGLPDPISAGDTLLLTLNARAHGQAGKVSIGGLITFLNSAGDTINVFATPTQVSQGTSSWEKLEVYAVVPENAVSFFVSGAVYVNETLTGVSYAAFDSFSLKQIPEPAVVTSFIALLAGGVVLLRHRNRRG